jgi:dihydropteroate synthase
MDDRIFESVDLKIPHPSLYDRPFALLPFADLLPRSSLLPSQEKLDEWRRKPPEQVPFRTRRSLFHLTQIVGILNITPDSFSDGGHYFKPDLALQHAEKLREQGIQILDIGAESTRPKATPVSPSEEWNRLAPILEGLKNKNLILSVDTRHAEVAQRAIQAGAHWINDVGGFNDPAMQKAVAESEVDLVMMHSLTVPPIPGHVLPSHLDPVIQLLSWAENRIQELESRGISRNRIIFDPGLGFGKTVEQSWEILRGIHRFQTLGIRILVGHSRKSFLSCLTQVPSSERDIETLTLSLDLASQGVDYIRIHQTEMHSRALKAWTQVNGMVRCRN